MQRSAACQGIVIESVAADWEILDTAVAMMEISKECK